MTIPVAVILACIIAGLGAIIGVGVQALRHGSRTTWRWLLLPVGALLTFGFIPASIGHAEKVWGITDPRLLLCLAVGCVGLAAQFTGWRAVLRPRLRAGQCPRCEYEAKGLSPCPECGRAAGED